MCPFHKNCDVTNNCGKVPSPQSGPRNTPSGVEIQVDLPNPYGQSILQVDLDTVYVHAFDLDT